MTLFQTYARYVNDVHLPRFIARCQLRSDRFCHCQSRSNLLCQQTTYTEQPPAARCITGIQRISHRASALLRKLGFASADSPRTVGMIAQTAAPRQSPHPQNWRDVSDTSRQNANSAPHLQQCGILHRPAAPDEEMILDEGIALLERLREQ